MEKVGGGGDVVSGTGESAVLSDCRGCGWFVVRAGWEDRCSAKGELQAAFGAMISIGRASDVAWRDII